MTCGVPCQLMELTKEWTAPDCDLFASDCTKDPGPLPDAYVEVPPDDPNGVTTYGCAAGFAGNAVARCVPDDVCQSTLQYFGCEKTAACAAPIELIGCELDVTGCSDVQPGGSCEVKCRDPYAGWPSWALCKPDNVNSEIGLLVVKPECTLLCDDPPNEPEGYIKVSGGNGWACAPGYGGEADWTCVIDSVCASKKVLSGCSQLARCILPVENSCMYDFTECIGESAAPGSSCKVHCKRPYQGNSTSASCPLGNTDPLRELDWEAPVCTLFCAEVANVPVGYLSHPYLRVYGGWQCASGYAGVPMITCGTDLNCNPQLQFAGCSALLPCDPPTLTAGEQCSYQHACISVRSGDSCEVTCRPPYVGGIATATCPPNNTLLGQKLNWAVPDCNLECPMPNPLPAGYLSNGLGPDGKQAWICAPRWKANPEAKAECNIHDGDCVAAYTFSGCVPERECAVPHDAPCSVDWSQCHNDPVDPPGYVKTRFMCATNYSGSPSSRCAADFLDQCNPTYSFSGCNLRVPCAPPRDQLCMFDFSECQSVPPGGNCTIRCGSDYLGRSTIAYCPSDNTDPNGELVYLEPICSLKPCEMNVPAGYIETPCGWVCDEGYIGEVSWYCAAVGSAPGQCRSELVISGCTLTVECAPLFVNDTCRTNASQCMSLQPGQGCNVTCAEPYTGGQGENATWAYCPGSTTRTGQQPVWGTLLGEWAIDCDVECALPDPIPVGYVLSNGRWLCDVNNQYSGAALAECIVNDTNCEPEYVLSGCFPTTPCDFPSIDSCQHDVSACPSDGKLLSGTSCEVKCLSPYMTPLGEPHGTMECRDPNIDPLGAVWTPPSCILGCSEPSSQTGYRNVFGEWQCAPGYRGPGAIWSECVVDETSCVAFPRLFGCEPYVPCLAPSLTPEQQCMIDLENGFCNGVDPGEVCTVYCKTPYAGDKLGAGCPADNIDPAKVINWLAPVCHCPVPIPLPEGYWYLAWSTYACAPGYYGQASYRCEIDLVTCLPNVILTGCYPLSPCDRPQVDDYELCKLDFTECQGPIQPGESCNVTCKEGFNANTTYAECPADNTVANFAPDLDLYCGEYTCLSADDWAAENPLPRGYDVGTWRCADGFRGSVSVSCAQSDECGGTLQLFGCVPLMPCSTPRLQGRDLCRYNFSECEDTFSGGFCEFHCVPPFSGRPGRAFCKPDNVDPHTELEFIPPDCSLQCPDPNPVPPGYVKIENCGWQCAPGYDGRPQEHCDVDDDCNPQLTLSGCAREEKCILPPSEMFDPCRFDFSGCGAETPPGSSCEVKCKAPFSGQNFLATCPQGNTIPRHPLTWNNESCTLACPMPEPVPLGFALRQDLEPPDSGWICSQGYVGQAEATCMQSPGCGAPILRLSGCDENVPCKNPAGHNQCEFESFCGPTIAPGASCETRCKFPYEGNSSMASCPNPNTQRDGPADWEAPDCNLMCPQIAPHILHPNYTLGEQGVVEDVVCAEGAVGAAAVECRINTTTCEAFWHFWGCLMLQPCILPVVHQCRTDVGNCSRVYPGEFCIMSCQEGYSGGRCRW
ncbi:unnamed protein product [Durusdinium trenchii]|uniref:Uncharacterized protein n=1 Tax=Durusdinium trenchii TaxID=1381693 RepID=A0ABP0MEC6_9DINO